MVEANGKGFDLALVNSPNIPAYHRLGKGREIEAGRDEANRVFDDRVEVELQAIPLGHREFREVPLASLAAAKYAANRVNVGIAGRQQALHVDLG